MVVQPFESLNGILHLQRFFDARGIQRERQRRHPRQASQADRPGGRAAQKRRRAVRVQKDVRGVPSGLAQQHVIGFVPAQHLEDYLAGKLHHPEGWGGPK